MRSDFKTLGKTFLVLFILLSFTVIEAANAKVKGTIKDELTNEPLFGANVILIGTALGAASDFEGNYEIRSVPPGTYILKITYIGYEEVLQAIDLIEDQELKIDFVLKAVTIEGEEVLVTAQAQGQKAAINQQLSTQQIANVVSAAKIQELPDANAAESLGRLPGISVLRSGGEANEVVIRGLAPKFNRVLVNGVDLTSSNPNNNSVDLSMISSTMLAGLEVRKSVSADMDANVIGGTINMELREAKINESGNPKIGVLIQSAYNGLENTNNQLNNYKYVFSGEDRFLDNQLGIFFQIDAERKNLTSNQFGADYTNNGNDVNSYITEGLNLNNIPRDRQRYDGALVADYKTEEGQLKFSNFFSSGTTDEINRGEYFGLTGVNGSNIHKYSMEYSESTLSVITNALKFKHQFPAFYLETQISHAYTETKDPKSWRVEFQQGAAGLGNLINQPDLDPRDIPLAANNDLEATVLNDVSNTDSFSRSRAFTGSIDIETDLNFSNNVTSVIKFGGMYRHQTRSYDYNTTGSEGLSILSALYVDNLIANHFPALAPYKNTTQLPMEVFLDPNYNYENMLGGSYRMNYPLNHGMLAELAQLLEDNAELINENSPLSYFVDQFNSITSDYSGHENHSAAYLMTTINIGSQITLIPGVRFQRLETEYKGHRGIQNTSSALGGEYNHYDTTFNVSHDYILPSVSLRYKPLSWFDVRLAYSNTLAYPDYDAIIPRIDVSNVSTIAFNNYELSPSLSVNYDAYLSFYNNDIGLLTIGGFYKSIDDLILPYDLFVSGADALQYFPPNLASATPSGTYQVSTFLNNPNTSTSYGFEIDWQTHFWYLPHPFDGLVLNVNFTHVISEEEYPYVNLVRQGRLRVPVDTSYVTRLLYQPDNIANVSLGYDYEDFSLRVSIVYQDNIFSGPDFWPQLRTTTSAYTRWDLSIKQKLPWFGIQVFANLNNINGERDIQVIQAPTGVPQTEEDYGMTADFGVRMKL